MRAFFLLLLLAGLAVGGGYPWYVNNFSGEELGSWNVYQAGGAFKPVTVNLKASQAPVRILVDLTAMGSPSFASDRSVLTLTVAGGGRTVLADTLTFGGSQSREHSPQSPDRIFRADAGPLTEIADGSYVFTIGQGDDDRINIRAVDLILRGGALPLDPRAMPAGISLAAVGLIGFVLASRRRRPDGNPNSQPLPPRWGRGNGPGR